MPVGNYAEFLQRLDAAAASLQKRQDDLNAAWSVVAAVLADNRYGHVEWAKRKAQVESLLDNQQSPGRASLRDLHTVATKMEPLFQARAERVSGRVNAMRERIDEINKQLRDLRLSREKLTTSRRVAEERENLNRAVLDFAGTAEGISGTTRTGDRVRICGLPARLSGLPRRSLS